MPVLYLAPWVDFGGSDKGTIDWFRWLDRSRFKASLITTQPSKNRRLGEVAPYAEEVWSLPDHLDGPRFPEFIFDFIHSRGVRLVHVMNSRLGYELLPDLNALPAPPKVVVQLHVEESDRSGYVRYATTRYGNLVDAFSVTSYHLSDTVGEYDIPRSRIHVIPTGVDADQEFNPHRVRPLEPAPLPGAFTILFAGRLCDQKDPLLMVEVARRLVLRHPEARVQVIGDGPLESAVRERVQEYRLTHHVHVHPPTTELRRWLASSDLLLMTSAFEGVPYLLYEAMAMEVPAVVSRLPGNVELMGDTAGILVAPRDDPDAYLSAVSSLIENRARRQELGRRARQRVLEFFTVQEMAKRHMELYEALLPRPLRGRRSDPKPAPRLTFSSRPASGWPPVSIVTPCFNHGKFLEEFLDGVRAQDYPELEVIIVDDGSTDVETRGVLAGIEQRREARVVWQERNRGPSAARNLAVSLAKGRYIFPVDADNILLPGTVRRLVSQIQGAGAQVGYIYPSYQFFGTRDYRFDAPEFNLHTLLQQNFTDTSSLLDREVFDAGFRYPEGVGLGHEDWDLVLSLAAHGIRGEPSREPTMLYRKQGFTRSDQVEYRREPFRDEVQRRYEGLYGRPADRGSWGPFRGAGLRSKTEWSPALSIMLADPLDFSSPIGRSMLAAATQQSCGDFELIAECPELPRGADITVRRLPPGLCETAVERLQAMLDMRRGRYLLVTRTQAGWLEDRAATEKLLRGMCLDLALDAVAYTSAESGEMSPHAPLPRIGESALAHSLAWRDSVNDRLEQALVSEDDVITALAYGFHRRHLAVQWRHLMAVRPVPTAPPDVMRHTMELNRRFNRKTARRSVLTERQERLGRRPGLPAMPEGQVPRWRLDGGWMPPDTLPLVRHIDPATHRRIITNDRTPPPGHHPEFDLGSIKRFAPPGTTRLVCRDGTYLTIPRGSPRDDGTEELGHLEETWLSLFNAVERATLPDGSHTLVLASERDPLRTQATHLAFLGHIETFPNGPCAPPAHTLFTGPSLIRWVDRRARRHRYDVVTAETAPNHEFTELGTIMSVEEPGSVPLWANPNGRISQDGQPPGPTSAELATLLRWTFAPANWSGFGARPARARAMLRRAYASTQILYRGSAAQGGSDGNGKAAGGNRRLLGFLATYPERHSRQVFAAVHPATGDQFLTHYALEATDMGFVDPRPLGYLRAEAPITGRLGAPRAAVPWASRFGRDARQL